MFIVYSICYDVHPQNTLRSTRKNFEKVKAWRRVKEREITIETRIESKHVHDAYNVCVKKLCYSYQNCINEKDSIIIFFGYPSQWSFSSALMSFTVKLYYHDSNWTIRREGNKKERNKIVCANRKAEKGYRFNGC